MQYKFYKKKDLISYTFLNHLPCFRYFSILFNGWTDFRGHVELDFRVIAGHQTKMAKGFSTPLVIPGLTPKTPKTQGAQPHSGNVGTKQQ